MTNLKLSADTPNAFIFALQASNANGAPLTSGQISTAREAAKSVLETLGCEVTAISDVITVQEHEDGAVLNIFAEIQG